jgi:hypothetical protein
MSEKLNKHGKKTKFDINFAEDPVYADRVAGHLIPRIRIVRTNRYPLDEALWRFFNMWNVTKDGYHGYQGRAQLYVPEVRKNVEAQARALTKAAFPSEDCFDVTPGLTGTHRGAEAWRAMQHWAARGCNLPLKYFVAMRQECLYGTAPIFLPWGRINRREYRSRKDANGRIIKAPQDVEIFNGPDFIPRDIFRWYSFNEKRSDLRDGCFEINPVSPFELKRRNEMGLVANYERIMNGVSNAYLMEEFARDVMRANSQGLTIQYNMSYAGEATVRRVDDGGDPYGDRTYMCTTVFADMVFPEACEDDEDPEVPIPMMVEIWGNDTCGLIQRNPFYHQSPPYVVGRYIQPNPDECYGQGIPWATQYMQYETNVKAEQGMDSATMALNPIAVIDPGLAGASNEFNIEPGAIWWANPAGVKLTMMPDATPIAHTAISNLRAMMQDYSDRTPALPSQLMGKTRSATQSEIVQDALSTDQWLFQLQNEQTILTPMLQQWEALIDQHMKDDQLVMILGRNAADLKRTLMSRQDLLGRYAYEWKGASQVANKQVQGRQMLDGLKVFTSMPPEMRQGMNFNGAEFFKTLWTDFWMLKDADKILGQPEQMVTSDATAENHMVSKGLEIEVLWGDDDASHIAIHDKGIEEAKNQLEKTILMQHILEHKKNSDIKASIKQQQQIQQAAQGQLQQLQQKLMMAKVDNLEAKAHKANPGGNPGAMGNRSQMSPVGNAGDQASGVRA